MSTSLSELKSHAFLMEAIDAKQRIYVEARSLGSAPVSAARVAGYADPDAAALSLENDPTIRAAVEVSVRIRSRNLGITRDDVLNALQDAYRLATTAAEMIAAQREIGKIIGAYEPQKISVEHKIKKVKEDLMQLPDDELAKLTALEGEYEVLEFEPEPVPVDAGSG